MKIFINDTPASCKDGSTITEILRQQSITPVNIAVAIDNTVVPKAQWDKTIVKDGSSIIIIKAVQGG